MAQCIASGRPPGIIAAFGLERFAAETLPAGVADRTSLVSVCRSTLMYRRQPIRWYQVSRDPAARVGPQVEVATPLRGGRGARVGARRTPRRCG